MLETEERTPRSQEQELSLLNNDSRTSITAKYKSPKHDDLYRLVSHNIQCISPISLTKEMFLENYSRGKCNLSAIQRPECLQNTTFLKAPEAYNELKRLEAVDFYINLPHWERSNRYSMLLKRMIKMFNCHGASISLINSKSQIVKHQIGLGFTSCSRQMSLDAHTILSSTFFSLLDASNDWRTKSNLLVKGSPNIKFYLGVPLLTLTKDVIGVLSIFDSYPRTNIEQSTVMIMKKIASEIMDYLDSSYKESSTACTSILESNFGTSNIIVSSNQNIITVNNKKISKSNYSNTPTKLLEIYGRATGCDPNNSDIVFEKDGSGTSYQYHSQLKFNKFSSPYDDMIDLNIWKQLLKSENLRIASNSLCGILFKKFNFDCVYIVNIRTTELFKITNQFFPNEKEIEVENYKFKNNLESRNDEFVKLKILGIDSNVDGIGSDWEQTFHYNAFKSHNGVLYQTNDSDVILHSGICLPFYKNPQKLTRRKKQPKGSKEKLDLFLKSQGYLISCFSISPRDFSDNEIGYIYGCASILRKLYFL